MSLDDDKRVVLDGIKTLGVDALMWREEQYGANDERCHWHDENSAIAALDRILAALDDAISERDSAYALLTDKQGTLDAAEKRARVAEAHGALDEALATSCDLNRAEAIRRAKSVLDTITRALRGEE